MFARLFSSVQSSQNSKNLPRLNCTNVLLGLSDEIVASYDTFGDSQIL